MSNASPALGTASVDDALSIPFIDDSGSSSCASSLLGEDAYRGEDDYEDDTASLNRLLDDAASRELSFNGLNDDLASLSCGYASLDAHSDFASDGRSEGGTGERKKALYRKAFDGYIDSPHDQLSSSAQSSPKSLRTSRSSIKSSDAVEEELSTSQLIEQPCLPPPLPPCLVCKNSSCSSSEVSSSSAISCTTCTVDSDNRISGASLGERSFASRKNSSPCIGSKDAESQRFQGQLPKSSSEGSSSRKQDCKSCLRRSSLDSARKDAKKEVDPLELEKWAQKGADGHPRQDDRDAGDGAALESDVKHRRVQSLSLPIESFITCEMRECSTPLIPYSDPWQVEGEHCLEKKGLHYPDVARHSLNNGDLVKPLSLNSPKTPDACCSPEKKSLPVISAASTPSPPYSSPEGASTPPTGGTEGGPQPTVPHHYISSLRVASMRGAADMGGALVARVATFLRSQYKSLVTSPLVLPWCLRYKLLVSEFDTTLIQVPLAPHLKVPPEPATVTGILKPHIPISASEKSVEDKPRRIFIEGEAGYCSSSICYRMAYDWAKSPAEPYLTCYSLVFVLTLRDFRGGSLFSYMCKEILPRHILSREAMSTLWMHIKKIEEKVLFLLVGYDELFEDEKGDIQELIDGQMFPSASVVMTSRLGAPCPIPPSLHRRFFVTGLNSEQTQQFVTKYFNLFNKPDCANEVLSLVKASQEKYGDLPRCPVMCLALCVLYEDFGGKLPSRLTDLFMSLIKHMARNNLLRRGEPMCYDVLPDKYAKLLQDFGKMALDSLKTNNPYFTGVDLKTKLQHGGEIVNLGILVKMRSMSKLNKKEHYCPAHITLLEFVAAFYLSGLIHSYTQLQVELDSLANVMDIVNVTSRYNSGVMILRYLVGILGRNAYLVFNIISQMGISHRLLFLLLRESGLAQMNVLEMCKHVSGREHVVVQTNSPELEDWGRLLYSPDCTLEGMEILLDFDGASKERHESFFTCLSFNESVKSVKLTCLVGGEFGETEVTRLVSYVRAVLTKRRMESFEIRVTSIEESAAEILSPVVDMICDTLPDLAQALEKLVLALELDGEQVVRLCQVLRASPQVKVLHLPHLACGMEGLQAVAQVIKENPLVSLNLAGSLSTGTPVDERSTCTGGSSPSSPTKEENPHAPLAFWSFVDAQGNTKSVFNSLPRSFYQSLPRRGRLSSLSPDKRNSDTTLLQKTSFPPPACSPVVHDNGFHQIFAAFRSEECRVCHLNISKCSLGAEDLVCLGETVRFSKCLSSLRMEGLSRMAEVIPVLIALQENTSLRLLDLTSPHILLGDAAFQVTLNSFVKNKSLRFLVLNGWTLQLESERSLREFVNFLSLTELQHLDLSGSRVLLNVHEGSLSKVSRQDDIVAKLQAALPPLVNNTLAFLNLDNFVVDINDKVSLKGPQLLFLLRNFPKLVDVSLASNLGADSIDDGLASRIFALLPSAFPCLRRLNITGWTFSLDNCEKGMRAGGKHLRNSQLREIQLSGVEVRETSGKTEMEHTLLAALTSNLHHLSLLSISGLSLTPNQATLFGKAMKDRLMSHQLELETKGLSYSSLKALRQALTEGGRYELFFGGGPMAVYQVKKVDRKDRVLGKWACISTLERFSE